jgi:hypothetical protein
LWFLFLLLPFLFICCYILFPSLTLFSVLFPSSYLLFSSSLLFSFPLYSFLPFSNSFITDTKRHRQHLKYPQPDIRLPLLSPSPLLSCPLSSSPLSSYLLRSNPLPSSFSPSRCPSCPCPPSRPSPSWPVLFIHRTSPSPSPSPSTPLYQSVYGCESE